MGKRTKIWRGLAIVVILAAVVVGGFVLYLAAGHNFHSVSEGKVYRSAQMSGQSLADAIQRLGIKSVVNLRGGTGSDNWYQSEMSTTQRLGVKHFDFSLSANREVTDREMEMILAAIDRAPKPVLIHCKNGADRTGLASALYLYGVEGRSADEAGKQLTIFCGHFPHLFWRDTVAMDNSYWRYVRNHGRKPYPDAARVVN